MNYELSASCEFLRNHCAKIIVDCVDLQVNVLIDLPLVQHALAVYFYSISCVSCLFRTILACNFSYAEIYTQSFPFGCGF